MKAIKLEKIDKVSEAINLAEGKAKTRQLTAKSLLEDAKSVEKHLKGLGLLKKHWEGVYFQSFPEGLPNAYKHRGEGTYAKVERIKNNWYVTDISRVFCKKIAFGSYRYTEVNWYKAKDHVPTTAILETIK